MKFQGILGRRVSPAHKLALLVATALIALAAPAAANATTEVHGFTDSGFIIIELDGDSAGDSITLTSSTTTGLTVAGDVVGFNDGYCTDASPVVCSFGSTDDVVVDTYMGAGNDTLDASGITARAFSTYLDGESGSDKLIGSPFDDNLYMDDGAVDQAGSSCGLGTDTLYVDDIDPLPSGCENIFTNVTPKPPPPPSPPSNVFTPGKFAGTTLSITTPGPGLLTSGPATGAGASSVHAIIAKKKKALVGNGKVTATGAGTFKLPVKLTSAGKKLLKKKHKLKVKVKVTFTPTGGLAASKVVTVTFKKK